MTMIQSDLSNAVPLRTTLFLADTERMSAAELRQFCQRFYQGRADLIRLRNAWMKECDTESEAVPRAVSFAMTTDRLVEDELRSCFKDLPFAPCLMPFIASALEHLPSCWNNLRQSARQALVRLLARTLSDVSHRAYFRWFDEYRPTVESGSDAFQSFSQLASDRAGIELCFQRYPQLARWLPMICLQWARNVEQFVGRLEADEQALSAFIGSEVCLNDLADIVMPDADRHQGGQSVLIAVFAGGTRLVYKPRDVEIEHQFSSLVEGLARLDERLAIPSLRVLSRSDQHYGWCEFIQACDYHRKDSATFLRRYYRRAGRLLAHISLLAGRDMHMENIIATEQGPVLIDGECLFQPDGGSSLSWWIGASGLLGEDGYAANGSGDIGGFTGTGGHVIDEQAMAYEATNTAEMRLLRRNAQASSAGNLPKVDGTPVGPEEWIPHLIDGLREALHAAIEHRTAIRSALKASASCPTRIVLRPSTDYGRILRASVQPDALAGGWERQIVYEPLIAPHVAPNQTAPDLAVLSEEHAALNELDIPVFTSAPDQHDLSSADRLCRAACFSRTSMSAALDRLAALDEGEIESCVRRARHCLQSNGAPSASSTKRWQPRVRDPEVISVTGDILDSVLDRLSRPLADSPNEDWMQSISLYTGKLGIALFCGAAAIVLKNEEAKHAATRLATNCWEAWTQNQRQPDVRLGAFEGMGSLVLGFAALSNILNQDIWRERSLAIAVHFPCPTTSESDELDLITGIAGWLAAVAELSLYSDTETQTRLLPVLHQSAQRLSLQCDNTTGGFAHGAAGVAFAFGKAAVATNDVSYEVLMQQALKGELASYDSKLRGWVFKTNPFGQRIAMNAWCNGTSGVALALSELRRLGVLISNTGADWQTMLSKLTSDVLSVCDHWCCGNGGRLAISHSLALAGHGVPLAFVSEAKRMLAAHYVRNGGLNLDDDLAADHLHRHSLFRGVSGIGYTFLRAMHPELIPDILAGRVRSTTN